MSEEGFKISKELDLEYLETFALTLKNVEESFNKLAENLINLNK